MESPGSITESPNKRQREDEEFAKKRSKQYNPKDKKKYTDEEWRLVEEVQGVTNMPLPGFKFTVNASGNAITLEIDGCPEGQYNQGIRWIGRNWVLYMPRDSDGAIKSLDKITVKHPLTFEEGKALEDSLVNALCECEKLKTFVAKGERPQIKNTENREEFFRRKIRSGEYSTPLKVKQDVNEETGDMFVPENGYTLAFKTGFLRKTKAVPDGIEQRQKAGSTFSRDAAVLDIIERSGKQFHPPPLDDAMGDTWSWEEFTESGQLTMMRFSGLVSGEFWELKKIDSKSNDIAVWASMPTKISNIRVFRINENPTATQKVDRSDARLMVM